MADLQCQSAFFALIFLSDRCASKCGLQGSFRCLGRLAFVCLSAGIHRLLVGNLVDTITHPTPTGSKRRGRWLTAGDRGVPEDWRDSFRQVSMTSSGQMQGIDGVGFRVENVGEYAS